MHKWHKNWSSNPDNKLYSLNPMIEWKTRTQKDKEVMLAILCMGHTQIIHNHLLKNEETSVCQKQYITKHVQVDCGDINLIQAQYYQVNNLKEHGNKINKSKRIQFLKENRFYINLENIIFLHYAYIFFYPNFELTCKF